MKQLQLLLLISFSCSQLISQPFFDYHSIANIPGSNPVEIQLADVDADNDLDVIVAYAGTSELAWFENQGLNNFGPKQTIASSIAPLRLLSTDINMDNLPDVVYSSTNNKVAWFQNLGNGSFSNEMIIDNAIVAPIVIQTADLDGDGLEDLTVVSDTSNEINWYKNLGNGNWSSKALLTTVDTRFLAVGDLDNDNDPDLLTENGQNVVWYENNGAGGFGNPVDLYTNLSRIGGVYIADITSDGKPDPIVLFDNRVGYRRNLGNGYFVEAIQSQSQPLDEFDLFALGDTDTNGDPNVVVASESSSLEKIYNINILYSKYFTDTTIVTGKPVINDIKIGDLNNDGDLEIFSCGSDQVIWFENLKPVDYDADGFTFPADCDDFNADVYPGAPEICDGLDNDCDGIINEPAPDLVPQIFLTPNPINVGVTNMEMAIRILNTTNIPTDSFQIIVSFRSSPYFNFVWNISSQFVANRIVDNTTWNYLGSNGLNESFHHYETIPAFGSRTFGMSGQFFTQTSGTYTMDITLQWYSISCSHRVKSVTETIIIIP